MPSRIRQTPGRGDYPEISLKYDTLVYLRSVFIAFTQGLYATAPEGYKWTPDLETTQVIITDEAPINIDVIGKRPAISFTRGPIQSYNFSMGDMVDTDLETGAKTKAILVAGTMSINCCSRIDLESERLAWFIAEQMGIHRELLMKKGFFDIGRNWVVGAPSPAGSIVSGDGGDEWYVTLVSMPFQIHRNSLSVPLGAEILNGFDVRLNSTLQVNANAKGPVSTDGANLPYEVKNTTNDKPPYIQPHPLNPNQNVVVKSAYPFRQGLRPPSINGRTIPIVTQVVEESGERVTTVQRVRI